MNAYKIAGLLMGAALVVAPLMASAATVSSVQFQNGDNTISCVGGSMVNATFKLTTGPGEVVEWIRTQVDTQPFVDTSVGGTLGIQEGVTDVTAQVKCPPNTGTYNLYMQGAGIYGGIRSVDGADNVVVSNTFGSAIRTVADASNTTIGGSVSGDTGMPSWLAALIAALKPAAPPAPTVSAVCTAYAQANAGSMQGMVNPANIRLQGFLLSQGASIPALAAGAAFGFDGPQTQAAVSWFQGMNHCN